MNKIYWEGNVRTLATQPEVKPEKHFLGSGFEEMQDSLNNPCCGNSTHAAPGMAVAFENFYSPWQWSPRLLANLRAYQ